MLLNSYIHVIKERFASSLLRPISGIWAWLVFYKRIYFNCNFKKEELIFQEQMQPKNKPSTVYCTFNALYKNRFIFSHHPFFPTVFSASELR